ncbi:MAG: DUF3996 domain-containing protein [Ignavibacteriales bacterium]|nr:DUF3996 domain-containing protein [Ignavibacteriales bacterium]
MKRTLALLVLSLTLGSLGAAQVKKVGIGLIVGAPTGFSVKYWSKPSEALQGFVGGGFGGIAFGADYLFHSNAFRNPQVPFYYGPGVFLGAASFGGPRYDKSTLAVGARFMFGADYIFPNDPFDIAFEIGPALILTPVVGLGLEGGISFRFYP